MSKFIEVNIVQVTKEGVSDPTPTMIEASHIIMIANGARGLGRITMDNGEKHFVTETYDELKAKVGVK